MFPWYFHSINTTADSQAYFCHGLYNYEIPQSNFYKEVAGPIMAKIPMYSLLRCKCNLYSRTLPHPTYSKKHVDMIFYGDSDLHVQKNWFCTPPY